MSMQLSQLASTRASAGFVASCLVGCTLNISAVTFAGVIADRQMTITGRFAVRMSDVIIRDALNTNGTSIFIAYTDTSTLDITRFTMSNMRDDEAESAGLYLSPYSSSTVGTLSITVDDALFDSNEGPAFRMLASCETDLQLLHSYSALFS